MNSLISFTGISRKNIICFCLDIDPPFFFNQTVFFTNSLNPEPFVPWKKNSVAKKNSSLGSLPLILHWSIDWWPLEPQGDAKFWTTAGEGGDPSQRRLPGKTRASWFGTSEIFSFFWKVESWVISEKKKKRISFGDMFKKNRIALIKMECFVIHGNWTKWVANDPFFSQVAILELLVVQAVLGSSRRCSYNLSATTDRCSSWHRPGVEIHMAGRGLLGICWSVASGWKTPWFSLKSFWNLVVETRATPICESHVNFLICFGFESPGWPPKHFPRQGSKI